MKFSLVLLSLVLSFQAHAGSVYDHINTEEFKDGAKAKYLSIVASVAQRSKIIAAAEEECGGRYEGTKINIVELSHEVEALKDVVRTPDPNKYFLRFDVSAKTKWLVTENILCSMHGGHYSSVLHSRIISGSESAKVTYRYVNDEQVGPEVVSDIIRNYPSFSSPMLSGQYKTPYGTVIAP